MKARASRRITRNLDEVLHVVQRLREQHKTLREIAATLNSMGLNTASGAQWHPSTVRVALLSIPMQEHRS